MKKSQLALCSAFAFIMLLELPVVDAHVSSAGASSILLTMDGGTLSGTLAGVGELRYHGTVKERKVSLAGVSQVKALD